MIGFIVNAAAAAFNAALWLSTGNDVSLVCMIFSASVAVAFLVWEVTR